MVRLGRFGASTALWALVALAVPDMASGRLLSTDAGPFSGPTTDILVAGVKPVERKAGPVKARVPEPVPAAAATPGIPSSPLSRQAIARVRAGLEQNLTARGLRLGAPIFVRIFKESKELEMWVEGDDGLFRLFRTWPICTFSGTLGPKLQKGDKQAPEGFYFVRPIQLNPSSDYHLSFNLGYPNRYDRAHGRTGSALMVHGRCVSVGCYAMTDPVIEEIFALADAAFQGGQPFFRAHVFPFRMNAAVMAAHPHPEWDAFWWNLKEGYDFFEANRRPPDVGVRRGRYVFAPDNR